MGHAPMPAAQIGDTLHMAPTLGWNAAPPLPDRHGRAHPCERRRVALLQAPDLNASIDHASFYPCTVDGSCDGPRAGVDQLGDVDVPPRQLGPHPREHALPRGLREERGGSPRSAPLPALLLRGRARGHRNADRDDSARRDAGGAQRRSWVRAAQSRLCSALRHPLPGCARSAASSATWASGSRRCSFSASGSSTSLFEANFGLFESSAHGGGVAFFAHMAASSSARSRPRGWSPAVGYKTTPLPARLGMKAARARAAWADRLQARGRG